MVENDESGGNQDNWVPILCGINISRPWLVLGTKTPWLGLGKYYDTCSNEFEASNWDIMNWLVASQRLYPSFLQPKFRLGGEWWKWWQKSNSGLLYKRMMVWVLCATDISWLSVVLGARTAWLGLGKYNDTLSHVRQSKTTCVNKIHSA